MKRAEESEPVGASDGDMAATTAFANGMLLTVDAGTNGACAIGIVLQQSSP